MVGLGLGVSGGEIQGEEIGRAGGVGCYCGKAAGEKPGGLELHAECMREADGDKKQWKNVGSREVLARL